MSRRAAAALIAVAGKAGAQTLPAAPSPPTDIIVTGRVENPFDARVIARTVGGSLDLGAPRRLWLGHTFTQGPR